MARPDIEHIQANSSKLNLNKFGPLKLIWPLGISILLSLSVYFSIFTPLPLSFIMLYSGRKLGTVLFSLGLGLVFLSSLDFFSKGSVGLVSSIPPVLYLISCLVAAGIAEVIFKRLHPVRGMLMSLFSITVILIVFAISFIKTMDVGIHTYVTDLISQYIPAIKEQLLGLIKLKGAEEYIGSLNDFNDPSKLAKEILLKMPFYIFIGVSIWLWATFIVVLKNHAFLKIKYSYPFTHQDLLNFKVHSWVIYPLIVTLLFCLFGSELNLVEKGMAYEYGQGPLSIFITFYFFQGFGVMSHFLDAMKFEGIFRSVLTLFLVYTLFKFISLVGLLDGWLNFKKYLNKKEGE